MFETEMGECSLFKGTSKQASKQAGSGLESRSHHQTRWISSVEFWKYTKSIVADYFLPSWSVNPQGQAQT